MTLRYYLIASLVLLLTACGAGTQTNSTAGAPAGNTTDSGQPTQQSQAGDVPIKRDGQPTPQPTEAPGAPAPDARQPTPQPGDPGEPSQQRVLGIIDFHQDGTQGVLEAPDTVQAGKEFTIKILTFGGGCEEAGETEVEVNGSVASITVHDLTVSGPGVMCTMQLKRLEHTATLVFEQPGTATIEIHGRRVSQDTPPDSSATVLKKQITVE